MWLRTVCIILLVLASDHLDAQRSGFNLGQSPSYNESSDTIKRIKEKGRFKKNWRQPYPNPTRAGMYSLAFPGAGQIYNKRYWKVPLVWGAVGGVIYAAVWNTNQYKRFDQAYRSRVEAELDPTLQPSDEFVDTRLDTADKIKTVRDGYDRNRQTAIIASVAVYALNALEAYVDAHLKNFDIDDDLSFEPILRGTSVGPYLGVGIQYALN